MDKGTINTHTLYSHYCRLVKKAKQDIAQTEKYLLPESEHYLPAYIERLEALRDSKAPPKGVHEKITTMQANLYAFRKRSESAKEILEQYPPLIREMEEQQAVFRAPPEKEQEYLYVLDEETCRFVKESDVLSQQSDTYPYGPEVVFGDLDVIELTDDQTDAVRIWSHQVCVENLHIHDKRQYDTAHRDAIQLIPPPLAKIEGGEYVRIADQMAGSLLENVTVQSCNIAAPDAPLQGIFSSDGFHRNVRIINNEIRVKGRHAIALAGLLDGCEISNNRLHQVPGSDVPRITLYPGRIGGNMAEDGVVCILSFAREENCPDMLYDPVLSGPDGNCMVKPDGTECAMELHDNRDHLPHHFIKMGIGLQDFHYHRYLQEYSGLTLGTYRDHDPWGAKRMEEWLEQRVQAYRDGRKEGHPLGQPSSEQAEIGARFLQPALAVLQDGSVDDVRLVDLDYTAIRSFAMKRLAILNARVEPLMDIALLNQRRALSLEFLLEEEQLSDLQKVAFIDATLMQDTGQPIAYLEFSAFFNNDSVYSSQSSADGSIVMDELPLGSYILHIKKPEFYLWPALEATNKPLPESESLSVFAGGLLKKLRDEVPVLKAFMLHSSQNAEYCLQRLENYLARHGIASQDDVTDEVRQACLSALGLGVSTRKPYRNVKTLVVKGPRPLSAKRGCLLAPLSWLWNKWRGKA